MDCPICEKEAKAHIYYCAKCATCLHEKCWPEHLATAHRENK